MSLLIVIFPLPTFFMLSNKDAKSIWLGGVLLKEDECSLFFFTSDFWSGLTIVLDDWTFLRGGITLGEAAYLGFACLGFRGCRASLISCSIKWNSSSELTSIIYMLLAFNSLHQLHFAFTKLLNIHYHPTRFYPRPKHFVKRISGINRHNWCVRTFLVVNKGFIV